MNVRSPATSLVAALDEPWRFLRARFSDWAPAAFALATLQMVPGLLVQWFANGLQARPGELPNLVNLLGLLPAYVLLVITASASLVGAFVIATRVLDGERAGVVDVLLTALSPRVFVVAGIPLLLVMMGFGCVVGGPMAAALLGFVPAAVLARPGAWFGAWGEAFGRATVRASPRDAGPPAFKLAAIALIFWGLNLMAGQLAGIPALGWMAWNAVNALGSSEALLGAVQASPPFVVGAAGVLLGTVLSPFPTVFLGAAVVLLWRDVERVRAGDDLEALVDGHTA